MRGKIRRVFPGGNTSEGFYSYYNYLLEKGTKRIFVIKGGPGVGKSTLMKRIGNKMIELGYDVEFHHCSSDNNSLDGIVIEGTGIVMVDGTAPHIVDPRYPGGLDEIINIGEFWDIERMQNNKEKIIACTNEVSRLFARAYRFLAAARPIAENIIAAHKQAVNFAEVNQIAGIIEKSLFEDTYFENKNRVGSERHLFGSAYTPDGHVEFTESILQDVKRIYYIEGEVGTGKTTLMKKIAGRAVEKGLDVEIFHAPLIPWKIETVIIKDLNTALTSSGMYKEKNYKSFNLNEFMDKSILAGMQNEIKDDSRLLKGLIEKGITYINKAKQEHDVLEKYYIPNMNFEAVGEKYEEILSRILCLIGSKVMAASAKIYN